MKQKLTVRTWHGLSLLIIVFICFPLNHTKETFYVTPTPDTPCPGEPCHTLSQYADHYFKNFSSNTTLVFLSGDHNLNRTITIGTERWGIIPTTQPDYYNSGHSSLALLGSPSSLPEITSRIVCTWPAGFVFSGITELHISSLAFISCGHGDSAAVSILSVQNIKISNCIFQNNTNTLNTTGDVDCSRMYHSSDKLGGAVYVYNSTLTLAENTFQNNFAQSGGALYTYTNNTITISDTTFQNNSAIYRGGAVFALTNNTLTFSQNTFQNNSIDCGGGGLYIRINNTLTLSTNTFQNNYADGLGGAVYAYINNTLTLTSSKLQNNSANYSGGALNAWVNNTITLLGNNFQNNSASFGGGAICLVKRNTINISDNAFQDNSASHGGALCVYNNNTAIFSYNKFQNNSVHTTAGAIYAELHNTITLSDNTFQNNSAGFDGGVITAIRSTLKLLHNTFDENSAGARGGVLKMHKSVINLTDNNLNRNTAGLDGGAIFCDANSTLRILGIDKLNNNKAQYGGGITGFKCQIVLAGDLLIANNNASFSGGGLYVDQSQVSGHANFTNNFATLDGGAVYSTGSTLYFKQHITFIRNSALNGGGLLLTEGSQIHLQPNSTMNFTNNFVGGKGGAIKVEKSNPLSYCAKVFCEFLEENICFFQIKTQKQYYLKTNVSEITELHNIRIYFQNNTAVEAGAGLYGGSVDQCYLNFIDVYPGDAKNECHIDISGKVFSYITISKEQSLDISSDPLYICICEDGEPDCSVSSITRSLYPGGKIEVPIIAYGQRKGTTPAVIHVTPDSKIEVDEPENTQSIKSTCTPLTYTVRTSAVGTAQEMTLYTEDPCPLKKRTVSSLPNNTIKVYINVRNCPPGFELLQLQPVCHCAQRLQRFTNSCNINDGKIERSREIWVGYEPNSTSDGLILHPHCPFDYCTPNTMYIAVDDSDEQCSNNRTGLLCGRCGQNFSLLLGTNHCQQCSNTYLWLIVAFAFAGVALVLLLLALRLTVAVGTISGLVFYANIFAMNSATFYRPQVTNVLTVFIAWLNLDLGIETCFYNGMDAYAKAWLQFVFPVYVWALVGIIILISHYSSKVATILGTNPIAVLATLFLLSYTKFLRTIIAALSYTLLEYPNNSQIAVWLYDGNIGYFSNKHIPLFTVASVCLIVLFLPYTLFLIFSQWLRSKSGQWRIFYWVNHYRVLPFLDAYHGPYTDKHRYWTGLMLLVRCILFLLFAFNALGDPNVNLLAIGSVTVVLLIVHAVYGNSIYKTWYLNMLELSFIANLTILSLATLYIHSTGGNQNAVTFISISIAFATFIGIINYHLIQQVKGTPRLWRKMFPRYVDYEPILPSEGSDLEGVNPPSPPDSSDGSATVTHINFRKLLDWSNDTEFREPCLEIDN